MESNRNVKRRRLDKIKQIQERRNAGREHSVDMAQHEPLLLNRDQLPIPAQQDGPWNDPEAAWKSRMQRGLFPSEGADANESYFPKAPSFSKGLAVRFVLCGLLFAGVWGMFRMSAPWAETGQRFVQAALTEPMNTEPFVAWYESKLRGTPSILPSFERSGEESVKVSSGGGRTYFAPAKGVIASPYSTHHEGIVLATEESAPVYAMDTGLVSFAGTREDTGFTVELQHPGGTKTVYGGLSECKLEVNDWIKGGEAIGKSSGQGDGGRLYFAVLKEGRYVNPADVVAIVP